MKPVVDMLSALQQSIKGVELTLGAGTRQDVFEDVLDGDFDLVIASQTSNSDDRIRTWILFHEQCRLVVPERHPFAGERNITLTQLDRASMVQRIECCLHGKFQEACAAKGVTPIVRHRAASEEQLQHMILAGFGLGICSPSLQLAEGLVALPFADEDMDRDIVLATVAGRRFSAATDAFVKIARARDWSQLS